MTNSAISPTQGLNRELPLDQLDAVAGGFPISYQDGILAIGIKGVIGVFIGDGCIGGWIGTTGVAVCK
jgi:hypothetical protein